MKAEEIKSTKGLLRVTTVEEPVDQMFVMVVTKGSKAGLVPELEIISYVNLNALPDNLRNQVRAHLKGITMEELRISDMKSTPIMFRGPV